MNGLDRLRKRQTLEIKADSVEEIAAIQGDAIDAEMCTDVQSGSRNELDPLSGSRANIERLSNNPLPDMENPFGSSDDEANAVEAIQATIDPDPERLPMIANARNPRANAIGHTVSHYIQHIAGNKTASIPQLAAFASDIIETCMKHEIGQTGKENRTRLYLEALKARMAFEEQQQLTAGDKAFGKR